MVRAMTAEVALVVYLVGAALGFFLLYLVVRAAVVGALRTHAIWQAKGGVQKVLEDETFARTGIRPKPE